jgi:NAD(P)-dependent dehydrogenase (short-subunit alcohol dehydrogenase family)
VALNRYGERAIVIKLDVTDRSAVHQCAQTAIDAAGHIDVLVNNAGYGLAGAVEEVTEEQARQQLETNFFGALWVTQAFLAHLRQQKGGNIIQISSVGDLSPRRTSGFITRASGRWRQ